MGVAALSRYFKGEWNHIFSMLFHTLPRAPKPIWSRAKSSPMSEVNPKPTQLAMERWVAAARKRLVWPIIQFVIKPP